MDHVIFESKAALVGPHELGRSLSEADRRISGMRPARYGSKELPKLDACPSTKPIVTAYRRLGLWCAHAFAFAAISVAHPNDEDQKVHINLKGAFQLPLSTPGAQRPERK